jgi:hypothetical protein
MVDRVSDQYFNRPAEKPEEKEEVAEYKATFLDALKGLGATRIHCTDIIQTDRK